MQQAVGPKQAFSFLQEFAFVLSTNPEDRPECQEAFKDQGNVFLSNGSSPELDLSILASCNHTIYDYGTFGLWYARKLEYLLMPIEHFLKKTRAGILAGGKVIHANGYCPKIPRIERMELAVSKHFSGWQTLHAQTLELA